MEHRRGNIIIRQKELLQSMCQKLSDFYDRLERGFYRDILTAGDILGLAGDLTIITGHLIIGGTIAVTLLVAVSIVWFEVLEQHDPVAVSLVFGRSGFVVCCKIGDDPEDRYVNCIQYGVVPARVNPSDIPKRKSIGK